MDILKKRWVVRKTHMDIICVCTDEPEPVIIFEMRLDLSEDDWSGLKHARVIVEEHNRFISIENS